MESRVDSVGGYGGGYGGGCGGGRTAALSLSLRSPSLTLSGLVFKAHSHSSSVAPVVRRGHGGGGGGGGGNSSGSGADSKYGLCVTPTRAIIS